MPSLIIPSIFTAIDKLTAPVRAMGKTISKDFAAKAQSGLAAVDSFSKKLIPGLGEASKQFLAFASTAAIVAAIVSGLSFSFNSLKEYDKALGSLRAVTGLTGEAFKPFEAEIMRVAKTTMSSSIDVAKAFEVIGSANSELLKSSEAMGAMTQAAITLSQASGDDLATTAGNLVGIMNQFHLGANEASRGMNVLAAGTLVGAATIPQVAESMKNFGSVAHSANLSIEQSVALIEVMGRETIFGAEAGTKLRGSILKLQQAGVGYASGQFNINDALAEMSAKMAKLKTAKEKDAAMTKAFGAENITTGTILLNNIGLFQQWTKDVTGTSEATKQAAEKNATLDASLKQLSDAWVTLVTGSSDAKTGIAKLTKVVQFLTRNLDDIVYWTGMAVASFVAFRTAILLARATMFAYNVVLGIYTAYATRTLVMTNANIVAQRAFFIASRIGVMWLTALTGVQWAWNAAMTANPIGAIIVGIALLIALVAVAIAHWDEWGAALSIFLGPLGMIVNLFMAFKNNWDMIVSAFKTDGILGGLVAIGKTLLDTILYPLQQILEVIANLTGSDMAAQAAAGIASFRQEMGVKDGKGAVAAAVAPKTASEVSAVTPTAAVASAPMLAAEASNKVADTGDIPDIEDQEETGNKDKFTGQGGKIVIEINDNTGNAKVVSNSSSVPVVLKSTSKRP
jgi:TP901 family phage tail tape measure protein